MCFNPIIGEVDTKHQELIALFWCRRLNSDVQRFSHSPMTCAVQRGLCHPLVGYWNLGSFDQGPDTWIDHQRGFVTFHRNQSNQLNNDGIQCWVPLSAIKYDTLQFGRIEITNCFPAFRHFKSVSNTISAQSNVRADAGEGEHSAGHLLVLRHPRNRCPRFAVL